MLSGPSELALRIAMQVNPDAILQDGVSQATLQIEASASRRQAGAQRWRFASRRSSTASSRTSARCRPRPSSPETTGARASPTRRRHGRPQPVDEFNVVTFAVTPIGTDFTGEGPRTAQLRLLPPGIVRPPNQTPAAGVHVLAGEPGNPDQRHLRRLDNPGRGRALRCQSAPTRGNSATEKPGPGSSPRTCTGQPGPSRFG